jgi:uncharacterized Zn-finger protein
MGIIAAHEGQLARPTQLPNRACPEGFEMPAQPVDTVEVTTTRVACDGGAGPSNHPKVYLTLSKEGQIECPYCGKRFVLKAGAKAEAH